MQQKILQDNVDKYFCYFSRRFALIFGILILEPKVTKLSTQFLFLSLEETIFIHATKIVQKIDFKLFSLSPKKLLKSST